MAATPPTASKAPTAATIAGEPAVEKPQPTVRKDRGIVKSVLSGDTLVVLDDKPNTQGPPTEKIITLSSLQAPKMARGNEPEAPFAWESREFLRKKVVGKKIQYSIDHSANTRDYVTAYLAPVGGAEPECINHSVLSEGWAELHNKDAKRVEALLGFEDAAKQAGKGIHAKDKPKSLGKNDEDQETLYKQLKGKPMTAIVEQVRTGSSVRVTVMPTRHTFQVLLSGVQCPGWKKDKESAGEPQPDPFAREAKFFVENHVLQREVNLVIDGVAPAGVSAQADRNISFTGSIEFQGHDVSEELLKAGLAKYTAFSAAARGQEVVAKLKAAEKVAKDNKRRIFAKEEAAATNGAPKGVPNEFVGKVVGVQNTGTLTVIPEGQTQEVVVSLSSIKTPKPALPNDEEEDAKQEDKKILQKTKVDRYWAAEGKEFLRRRLIGQKVRVVYDFTKPRNTELNLPEKSYYSVYQNDQNLAVVLVEQGYAGVIVGKPEERPEDFEVLLMAEKKAKEAKKGVYMDVEKVPSRRINDLCVDSNNEDKRAAQIKQTKPFLASFERAGPMKAIVDYVFSGARFKVTVPKQSAVFIFALSGVRVPKRGESTENDELSNAALVFSREKLHQLEVTIEVNGLDLGGNFTGSLYVGKKNFAVVLLENGFAKVHGPSADRLKDGNDLHTAEKSAKQKKVNVWKNWDEEAEAAKLAAASADSSDVGVLAGKSIEVLVTEVVDGSHLYVQIVGPESAGLDELVTELSELSVKEGTGLPLLTPKVGDVVRAQFSEDERWYRARVTEIQNGKYKLLYVDYGNSEVAPASRLRELPTNSDIKSLPAQAQLVGLAFVKPLKEDNDNAPDAKALLRELAGGRKMNAVVEYKDGNQLMLTLTDSQDNVNVSAEMLKEGLARLEKGRRKNLDKPSFVSLRDVEEKARQRRVGIWYYGDVADSDEDEREAPKKGAKPVTGKDAKGKGEAVAAPAAATGKKK